ncbi:MAG: LptF/LptG family permease [Ferruginibacter sp.]|nr:LptF/LptG family permease [Ferruginibacter sp.]
MIKKLDKLVLKSFIGPFIATFFITWFVLMMQILWKYVDDLVGKGLDFGTIGQFLWYASASLLVLALPIAILIASIMAFGNLGESFELVAVKSSGISLLRFMKPLIVVAILLSGVSFIFGNHIIPVANLKFAALYNDIFYKKPAFDLKEGVFFGHIPNYAIKVDKKDRDGKTIHGVLIYEHGNPLQDNSIIADQGVMSVSPDNNYLEFHLMNGNRYQERGFPGDSTTEFIRLSFKSFKKLFDLTSLKKANTSDSLYKGGQKMLSARQLNKNIDSLEHLRDTAVYYRKNVVDYNLPYLRVSDSVSKDKIITATESIIPDSLKKAIYSRSYHIAGDIRNFIAFNITETRSTTDQIRMTKMEWHRKYSMSFACLILFFIGAPLGSIIRKGGFGMPLVVAIIFFLIFHLLNMFGEKFVREDISSPFLGMWLSVLVLTPIGALLTYKAMTDSQVFNKEAYTRFAKRIKKVFTPSSK